LQAQAQRKPSTMAVVMVVTLAAVAAGMAEVAVSDPALSVG
jgi:uncharacterized membrane protein